MKQIRLVAVGRLKTPHWRAAAEHYHTRLSHTVRVEEIIVKDADASLPVARRMEEETARLLAKAPSADTLICLDERGACLTSEQFAALLHGLFDTGKTPCFIIGGAYGLTDQARARAARCLALGPMTLPHELARVMLLEQLYRAESIMAGTGYHH